MNYKKARDLAWKILLECNIRSLPVDVFAICRHYGITVLSYSNGEHFIRELDLAEHIVDNDAFSLGSVIFYDDTKPPERKRFSIAHEIGHIFLHIVQNNIATAYNREPGPNDDPIEAEANIFASRLLAPLCVLQFLNLNSAREISRVCEISYSAAALRYNRLCEIRRRNSARRKAKNHGTFLLSRLERKVIEAFSEYIEENKIVPDVNKDGK